MNKRTKLSFSINDMHLGEQVSPTNLSLPLLGEFVEQVSTFLRGSGRLDLKEIKTEIRKGSLAIAIEDETGVLEAAQNDYEWAVKHNDLTGIDPVRAKVIEEWQEAAKRNEDRVYRLFSTDDITKSVEDFLMISATTNFKVVKDIWLDVELYLYGRVYDLGGKNKSNVHIELENGRSVKIETSTSLLTGDKVNRLYKKQLLRVRAKQNFQTKEYKDETLISFEHYEPKYEEDKFMVIVRKARLAWRDIENPTAWVELMRRGNA